MPRLTQDQELAIDGLVAYVQSVHRQATFLQVEPDPDAPDVALLVHMVVPGDEALHMELMERAAGYIPMALIKYGVLLSLQLVRPEWHDLR